MPRPHNRLPPNAATSITAPGRHADGGGLYLSIGKDGRRRSWVFMFTLAGRQREAGLGPAGPVTLKAARAKAAEMRKLLDAGLDPLVERAKARPAPVPAFGEFAADFIRARKGSWSRKHARQWVDTVAAYCEPIAKAPVDQIDTEAVLKVLTPLWERAPETASRLRGRIEAVLDAARTRGHIGANRANPARWKGHLDTVLPKRHKLSYGHHTALPYGDVPRFVDQLHTLRGAAALALEFCILTATRTGETLGARFDEIDLAARVWTLPKERTKTRTTHRVPLCDRIIEIIAGQKARGGAFVFPGQSPGTHLTDATLLMVMRRLKVAATVHGFRSAFRDWAGNETNFPRELAEHALGHAVGSAIELAYRRSDALERRRSLMDAWSRFVSGIESGSNVSSCVERQSDVGRQALE
jgi:integrase